MKVDIDLQTKIADLLAAYPHLEDKLIELSPSFSKLRNPILRRTIARVTTLQQAALVANISPPLLMKELREAAGLSSANIVSEESASNNQNEVPDWFDIHKISVHYDARSVIEAGNSPMLEILELASKLGTGAILQVTAPFRPVPIIDILKTKGFRVWSNGDENYFTKE